MSYSLILVRVPPGASEDEIERLVTAATDAEDSRAPGPPDPEVERGKRALVDALLEACPELEVCELDHAALAKAERITEEEARQRFNWWRVVGPEEGAGFEIAVYDTFVTVEMATGGTDEDWDDLWRYLEILVKEGGFVVWDLQAPGVLDLAAGPSGDGTRKKTPKPNKRRRGRTKGTRSGTRAGKPHDRDDRGGDDDNGDDQDDREDDDGEYEPEDIRRGGEIAKLINRIVDDAITAPLAAAGFKRTGRTWRRYLDDGVVQVVNIQWSPRNAGVEGWFTLNAGVYFPELAKSLALFPLTKTPKEYDCHLRERPTIPGGGWRVRVPGQAQPDPDLGDGWWAAFFSWLDRRADRKAPAQHEQATRELRESLDRHTLPWLERVSTLRGARDHLVRRGPMFWAAHASLLLGERDEAKRLVEKDLAGAKVPEYAEKVREWGKANGLIS